MNETDWWRCPSCRAIGDCGPGPADGDMWWTCPECLEVWKPFACAEDDAYVTYPEGDEPNPIVVTTRV